MNLEWVITSSNPAVLFCLQLLLSTGIYCVYLKRRTLFVVRLLLFLAVLFPFSFVLDLLLQNVNFTVPFLIWLLLIPILYFTFSATWREVFFVSLAGLATQHCSLLLSELVINQFIQPSTELVQKGLMIPFYLLCTLVALLVLGRRIYREIDIQIQARSLLTVAAFIVIFSMILRRLVVDNMGIDYSMIMKDAIDLYSVMGCLVSLWLLFFANIVDELKRDQLMMEEVLRMEEEKHRYTQDTVEAINIKCHDLKHQLERMRTGNAEISDQALQELEDSVTDYSKVARTGNDVLDSILTEESLCCQRYHISFRCIADGAQLNFLDSTDLYSLFGNAIDNAIEASRQEPDEEKRSILVKVSRKDAYVSIHIENNCPHPVRFVNGLPQTDKEDRSNHGLGVRSMQYIAEKYNGSLVFKQENGLFLVNILLEYEESGKDS